MNNQDIYNSETELLQAMRERFYAAVIADILDDYGYRNQVMSHTIRPLKPETVVAGRAKTVLCSDVYEIPASPYQKEIEAVDRLTANQVLVCTTNGSVRYSFWGELLSTAAVARSATGAVIDGFTRDTRAIIEMDFPVFATGRLPTDSKGRGEVVDCDVPIDCGGVILNVGDIVFGDDDGVVIIPQKVEQQVIQSAFRKVSQENQIRQELLEGASVRSVFDKYGIL